jgi:hypothetical protein
LKKIIIGYCIDTMPCRVCSQSTKQNNKAPPYISAPTSSAKVAKTTRKLRAKPATNSTATYNPTSWNWMTKFKPSATNIIIPMVHSANSLALIIINIVLCGVGFVYFSKFIQGVVVVPLQVADIV